MTASDHGKQPSRFGMIVGLGNPGEEYASTYHNAGAIFAEKISGETPDRKPFSVWGNKPFRYAKTKGTIIVIPTTYMNESGKAVAAAAKHFGIKDDEIVIAHDDSDLPIGTWRLDFERGPAGHNGVRSIMEYLGSRSFWRIRIGVRGEQKEKAGDFVLKKMKTGEKKAILSNALDFEREYLE